MSVSVVIQTKGVQGTMTIEYNEENNPYIDEMGYEKMMKISMIMKYHFRMMIITMILLTTNMIEMI